MEQIDEADGIVAVDLGFPARDVAEELGAGLFANLLDLGLAQIAVGAVRLVHRRPGQDVSAACGGSVGSDSGSLGRSFAAAARFFTPIWPVRSE